jgi:hypothetical protein
MAQTERKKSKTPPHLPQGQITFGHRPIVDLEERTKTRGKSIYDLSTCFTVFSCEDQRILALLASDSQITLHKS